MEIGYRLSKAGTRNDIILLTKTGTGQRAGDRCVHDRGSKTVASVTHFFLMFNVVTQHSETQTGFVVN